MEKNETNLFDRLPGGESAPSVGVLLLGIYPTPNDEAECDKSLAELKQLAETSLGEDAESARFSVCPSAANHPKRHLFRHRQGRRGCFALPR